MAMIPKIIKVDIPEIIQTANNLSLDGKLAISDNNFTYLNIDNNYIHQLFPLLKYNSAQKPDYFGKKSAGAHITVIYPEENKKINKKELNKKYHFLIKDLVTIEVNQKIYYALLVESPSLLQLRRQYHLPDMLYFKGYSVGFHITIGVQHLR